MTLPDELKPIAIKVLDKKRFDALVSLSKSPLADHVYEEVAWFSNESETILGVVARDIQDADFAAGILMRGEAGRFEAFDVHAPVESEIAAVDLAP